MSKIFEKAEVFVKIITIGAISIYTGTGTPDLLTANRGDLFISDAAVLGNPGIYQNISLSTGSDWKLSSLVGPSDLGGTLLWSGTYAPTGATQIVTANGVLPTDRAWAMIQVNDTTSLVGVVLATPGTDQVTVEVVNGVGLAGNGVVAVFVVRP